MRFLLKTAVASSVVAAASAAVTSSSIVAAASSASSAAASSVSNVAAATTAAPAATTAAGAATTAAAAPVSVSFLSTGPSAVPLASITEGAATATTNALHPTLIATPGATPPISGAPALPSWSFVPGTFPALDLTPDVSSPQVSAWVQEVANSGVTIPNIAQTVLGGCANNTAAASDTSRCWWTCGECTRQTDITTCPDKLTWGVSFDDGPTPYTTDLLNFMDDVKIKSTFFIVGSRAISRPDILQAEYMAGHQLSVHTWSHPYLTTLTNNQIIAELGWTREAIRQITGVSPNTMRPPYGDIDDRVRAICQAMGMTPIIWTSVNGQDFDTNDWHIPSGQSVESVVAEFDTILDTSATTLSTGFIVLAHDLYQQTVELATGYTLPSALARRNPSFNLMPIITCQHKPLGDAYVETNNNQTNPISSAALPLTGTAAVTGTMNAGGSAASTGASSTTTSKSGAELVYGSLGAAKAMAVAAFAVVGGALMVV
ncbi:chitin deacetylase [Tulasnella sp. JGI-2019a]|nr:chitin deacetylase [Tulasnella sp. JGI-2019a]KAG9038327.1 chitin deacetylase [Tulasnella sp. JGI-2019a]